MNNAWWEKQHHVYWGGRGVGGEPVGKSWGAGGRANEAKEERKMKQEEGVELT